MHNPLSHELSFFKEKMIQAVIIPCFSPNIISIQKKLGFSSYFQNYEVSSGKDNMSLGYRNHPNSKIQYMAIIRYKMVYDHGKCIQELSN